MKHSKEEKDQCPLPGLKPHFSQVLESHVTSEPTEQWLVWNRDPRQFESSTPLPSLYQCYTGHCPTQYWYNESTTVTNL